MRLKSGKILVTAICLSLSCLSLTACIAVPKQAFNPVRYPDIKTIAIAEIEYNHKLSIRRYNPVYVMIGASGLVMQQLAMEQKSLHYQSHVGNLASVCEHLMLRKLQAALSQQGYEVHALQTGFWQTMKLAHSHRLSDFDAIMRLKIERLGFRAGSISAPYEPSLIVSVKMIRPDSRKVLYEDTLAIGYKPSGYRMSILDYDRHHYAYSTFADLLEHAPQSKLGIFIALRHVVERISRDLGKKPAAILVKADQDKENSLNN